MSQAQYLFRSQNSFEPLRGMQEKCWLVSSLLSGVRTIEIFPTESAISFQRNYSSMGNQPVNADNTLTYRRLKLACSERSLAMALKLTLCILLFVGFIIHYIISCTNSDIKLKFTKISESNLCCCFHLLQMQPEH